MSDKNRPRHGEAFSAPGAVGLCAQVSARAQSKNGLFPAASSLGGRRDAPPKAPKKETKHNHEKIPKGLDLKLSSGCILKTRNRHQGPNKKEKECFTMKYPEKEAFEPQNLFGTGTPNTAYARYFIGQSYLNPLTDPKGGLFAANVTFEPGCRNNWHIHHAAKGGGQLLLCTAGEGWYQEEGKPAVSLTPGSVVMIPAEVKHWHGAKKDSWFSHVALEVPGEGCSNEWCERVLDEEYAKLEG